MTQSEEIKKVNRIRQKVEKLNWWAEGFCYDEEEHWRRKMFIDSQVLYYLQVGEEVLDAQFSDLTKLRATGGEKE